MKIGKVALKLIRQVAPGIAAGLGGPAAGIAVKTLADAIGKPEANAMELDAAILGATPEQLLAIKQAEQGFLTEMKRLDIDVFALEVEDKKDARLMARQTTIIPQAVLSFVFIVGYFGLIFMIFSGKVQISDSIRDMANILIGVMTAAIPQILSFWFGSSHGSKAKNPVQ